MLYLAYRSITSLSEPFLKKLMMKRLASEKESTDRYREKYGFPSAFRPNEKKLIWIHAASVGESQSALILIHALLSHYKNVHILVTSGTLTSAQIMEKKLPENTTHQFYPLDHPEWVNRFLDHWSPDLALWMESELWPNMLYEIKKRKIPAALINARMSEKSFSAWKYFKPFSRALLSCFRTVLCQTQKDRDYYTHLGAHNVIVTDNLKYSAAPLDYNADDLNHLSEILQGKFICVYASTHDAEETMACRIHLKLKETIPNLFTIIIPRHPERGDVIDTQCRALGTNLNIKLRTDQHTPPTEKTDIYIANTLGELGLFYKLSPVAYIGRTMSADGGGGHNPIEAAQFGCAVIHGPNTQNLLEIFQELKTYNASIEIQNEEDFTDILEKLYSDETYLDLLQKNALDFAKSKTDIIKNVMNEISILIEKNKILEPYQ